MTRYNKFLIALVPVVLATLEVLRNALSNDDAISTQEWVSVLVAFATAVGVYLIPNTTPQGQVHRGDVSEVDPLRNSGRHTDIGLGTVALVIIIALAVVGLLALFGGLR